MLNEERKLSCVCWGLRSSISKDPRWAETVNCILSAQRYKLLAAHCLYYWTQTVCCFPVTWKSCAVQCGERCPCGADTEWQPWVPSSAFPSQGQSWGLLYYGLLFTKDFLTATPRANSRIRVFRGELNKKMALKSKCFGWNQHHSPHRMTMSLVKKKKKIKKKFLKSFFQYENLLLECWWKILQLK